MNTVLRLRQKGKNVSVLPGNVVPIPKIRYNQCGNEFVFLHPVMLILLPPEFWDGGRGQKKADMKNKPSVR